LKPENQNLKILVAMPEKTARGGINACEPPFLRELENLGIEVREEIYSFDNDESISTLQRVKQVWKTAFKFRKLLRSGIFDVIHINTAFIKNALLRDVFIVFLIGKSRSKIFLKFHGSDAGFLKNRHFLVRCLIRYLVKKVDGIGVLSSEEKQNFMAVGLDESKLFIVKNAVSEFPESEIKRDFSVSKENPLRLLFVARLIQTKGLFETIDAVSDLSDKNFHIVLDILGDGEIRKEAENRAKELNGADAINFHGHVSEETVEKFYRNSDLLIFPTYHHEGFPMVIFNAMANGLPIITTKIRAAADYLKAGENCLFCELKNSLSVADKTIELYQNEDLRRKISENNFKLAREFSAPKITPEYIEIYRCIANLKSKI
jgi:glycosyltransferase involved in cell wall biosynthesis